MNGFMIAQIIIGGIFGYVSYLCGLSPGMACGTAFASLMLGAIVPITLTVTENKFGLIFEKREQSRTQRQHYSWNEFLALVKFTITQALFGVPVLLFLVICIIGLRSLDIDEPVALILGLFLVLIAALIHMVQHGVSLSKHTSEERHSSSD